jgi:ankyrin repeat protein
MSLFFRSLTCSLRPKINANVAFVKQWLSKTATTFVPKFGDYIGRVKLSYAGWSGSTVTIRNLDRKDITDEDGQTTLKWAAMNLHYEFAETLLSFPNAAQYVCLESELGQWQSVHYASANGDADMLKLLLRSHQHCFSYWTVTTDTLTEDGAFWVYPMHQAAAAPSGLEAIKFIHQAGVDIDAKDERGWTAMHWAVLSKHVPTLQYLLGQGLSLASGGYADWKPLHLAADFGYVEVVRWLKESGAELAALNGSNNTPVHLAAAKGRLEVIRYLRDAGADVFGGNLPALHCAAYRGQIAVAKYLLQEGDVNSCNESLQRPLHKAAEEGHVEMIRLLASHGAEISSTDQYFQTPLHNAAAAGHVAAARELKAMGANLSIRTNTHGKKPYKLAQEAGFLELAEELRPPKVGFSKWVDNHMSMRTGPFSWQMIDSSAGTLKLQTFNR